MPSSLAARRAARSRSQLKAKVKQTRFPARIFLFIAWWMLVLFGAWQMKLFRVVELTCSHDQQMCSQSVQAELNRLEGKWMFDPTIENTRVKIQQFEPDTDQVIITKTFPDKMEVSIFKVKTQLSISCKPDPAAQTTQWLKVTVKGDVKDSGAAAEASIPEVSASTTLCLRLLTTGFTQEEFMNLHQLNAAIALAPQAVFWQDDTTLLVTLPEDKRLIINPLSVENNLKKYELVKEVLKPTWFEIDLRFEDVIVKAK